MIGPSLIDLQELVSANENTISILFMACSLGYLIGSFIAGMIYDKFNSQILVTLLILLSASFFTAIPWNTTIIGLSLTIFLMYLTGGGMETCVNVRCLKLWGSSSAPFLQSLHFAYGVGALLAPVIAAPFLSYEQSEKSGNNNIRSVQWQKTVLISTKIQMES